MEIVSYIVYALLGIAFLAFIVLLPVAILFNMKRGLRYRQLVAEQVERLRLARMLRALGVDVGAYVHHGRIVEIDEQMKRCAACANTKTCDEELANGKVDVGHIGYCENEGSLKELVESRAPRVTPPA